MREVEGEKTERTKKDRERILEGKDYVISHDESSSSNRLPFYRLSNFQL